MALITVSLMTSPALGVDPTEAAGQVIGSEGGRVAAKEAVNGALPLVLSALHVFPSLVLWLVLECA